MHEHDALMIWLARLTRFIRFIYIFLFLYLSTVPFIQHDVKWDAGIVHSGIVQTYGTCKIDANDNSDTQSSDIPWHT